jgi:hypothetical protein
VAAVQAPFAGTPALQVAMQVTGSGLRLSVPPGCPKQLAKAMQVCWAEDAQKRPTAAQTVKFLENLLAKI